MRRPYRFIAGLILGSLILALGVLLIAMRPPVSEPDLMREPAETATQLSPEPAMKTVNLANLEGVDPHFRLQLAIPSQWAIEAVPAIQAINIYDPSVEASAVLDQSQIFLRYFVADEFLTLQTVDILDRTELELLGRPAVRYRIQKRATVPDFANQPHWRNDEHNVTDIRETDDNPATFYVVARNPALDTVVFEQILQSIRFTSIETQTTLTQPVEGFALRVTKKRFGTFVEPGNSPVSPERFRGYHTGADAEFTDPVDQNRTVSVRAVLAGEIVVSRSADGYGGVIVAKHELDSQTVYAVYGHLKPASLLPVGSQVTQGQELGVLGTGGTAETDGERKHLHFAVYTGSSPSLLGYVATEGALAAWRDPLPLLTR